MSKLLEVRNLKTRFYTQGGIVKASHEIYARHKDLKGVRYNSGRYAVFNDAYWDR